MGQTALIYLHVTATLQLINCFKRHPLHELHFNTRFQLPSSLRMVKYNFNILVISQMQCSHLIQIQAQKCNGMHINFDAVYQGHSKFARETSKTQTAFIVSIFSDKRNPPFSCDDAQFILLRILRSSKYIKNTRSASESKPVHSRYSRLSQA